MKKHPHSPLLILTAIFAAFILGFFLGRNFNHETLVLSTVSTAPQRNILPEAASDSTVETEALFPININAASAYELTALPGIGEEIARRIVEFRTLNGDFTACEELMNVEGIGTGKLEAILDLITVGG